MTAAETPETDTPPDTPPGTVRVQVDPLSRLTMRELAKGSRKLGTDLLTASQQGHPDRPMAMAVVAWLLDGQDGAEGRPLNHFLGMRYGELTALGGPLDLGTELVPADDVQADDDDDDEPADDEAEAVAAVVTADPTAPRPGSC